MPPRWTRRRPVREAGGVTAVPRSIPAKRSTSIVDVIKVAASSAVLPLTALLTGPLLAHALGPAGRGYSAAISAPLVLLPMLFGLGFPDAAARMVAARQVRGRAAYQALVPLGTSMGVIAVVVILVGSPLMLHKYPPGITTQRLLALLFIPSMSLDVVRGIRFGEARYGMTSFERAISSILRCVVIVGLFAAHHLTIAASAVAAQAAALAGQLTLLRPRHESSMTTESMTATRRHALDYGVRAAGGSLAGLLLLRLDQVLMLPLSGARELGYYAVAVSLAEVPGMLLGQVRSLLLSEFSARQNPAWVAKACRTSLLLVTLGTAGAAALTPWVVPLLFGHAFQGAVVPAMILLAATIPLTLANVLGAAVAGVNRPLTTTLALLPSLVITLVGLPLLVPRYGANGAAVVSLASYVVVCSVMLRVCHRLFDLRYADMLRPSLLETLSLFTGRIRMPAGRGRHRRPA